MTKRTRAVPRVDLASPTTDLGRLSVRVGLASFGLVSVGFVALTQSSSGFLASHPVTTLLLVGMLAVGLVAGLLGGLCAIGAIAGDGERSLHLAVPLVQFLVLLYLMRGDLQRFIGL